MARTSRRGEAFPQLGGDPYPHHRTDKAGNPKYLKSGAPDIAIHFTSHPNFKDPSTAMAATGNFLHSIETAPAHTVASGMQWYPKVNDAVRKGISTRGFLSGHGDRLLAGSGLVAAVSPNMDWENNNIDAFKELKGLRSSHWDTIMAGDGRDNKAADEAAKAVVRGMSISSAPLDNLRKAGRIIRGEHVESVLDPSTAPKTNRFAHNIAHPDDPRFVTIDGRAFDTMTNRLRPWEYGRGISSAALTRGTSRYEDAESIVQGVAHSIGVHPSAAQAISWEHTKFNLERSNNTRQQGPNRVGQPYFDPRSGLPVLHR
jgi:hypothetical protein